MNEKNLALFIYEVGLILYGDEPIIINDNLLAHLNEFIYKYHKEYYDSFSLLFDMNLLKEFIDKNYDVLYMEPIMYLIIKYSSNEKYAELVEKVGKKTDAIINDLALAFIMYFQGVIELSNRKPTGYPRILH